MITIIDYNMGNIASIQNMLKKIGEDSIVTSNPKDIEVAEKLILPGVGAFDYGMRSLHELNLVESIKKRVLNDGIPILGICLGMQLMTASSEEGILPGLGLFDAKTLKFVKTEEYPDLKIPHMGWNYVDKTKDSNLFQALDEETRFYFVHSYYVKCNDPSDVLATAEYGDRFACSIGKKNIYGVQFHPEKSHKFGMKLLKNYVELI